MTSGLDALLPRHDRYVDMLGGWSVLGGPMARAEGGWRVAPNASLFVFGQTNFKTDVAVGGGGRITW